MSKPLTVNGKPLKLKAGQYLAVDSDAFNKDPDGSEFRKMANAATVRELKRRQQLGHKPPKLGPSGKSDLVRNMERLDSEATSKGSPKK